MSWSSGSPFLILFENDHRTKKLKPSLSLFGKAILLKKESSVFQMWSNYHYSQIAIFKRKRGKQIRFYDGAGTSKYCFGHVPQTECINIILIIKSKTELQKILLEISMNKSWSLDPCNRAGKKKAWYFRTTWSLSNIMFTRLLTLASWTMLFITGTTRGEKSKIHISLYFRSDFLLTS